jgi:hypothetical protein
MKTDLQNASSGSNKNYVRFLSLFLFFTLSINLSGQNIQSFLTETWVTGNWVRAFQQSYTYDVNGYKLTSLSQAWDVPSLSWGDIVRSNYSNNPNGTANVVINQSWDGSTWNDGSRSTFTYNASKQVLTTISETWIGMWMNGSNHMNTYDASGYLTSSLTQLWDIVGNAWKNSIQTTYTNYPNGTVNFEITQTWDGISAWVNSGRSTYTYNGTGRILSEVSEIWVAGNWQNSTKQINTYDGSGYLTTSLSQVWDVPGGIFKDISREVYINNSNGTPSQVTTQNWDDINGWVNDQKLTYNYTGTTAISETLKDSDYTIFPNPANNVITIRSKNSKSGSSYSITDQTGKIVLSGKLLEETTSVDITTLNNGIYFIKIGDRSQPTFKVIKQGLK